MTLRGRLNLWLALLFAGLAVALFALQSRLLDELLIHQTTERIHQSARGAWALLRGRQARLETLTALLAESTLAAADQGLPDALTTAAGRWKVDALYVEENGRVVASAHGAAGARPPLPTAPRGFALVPRAGLEALGVTPRVPGDEGLVLFASAPLAWGPGRRATLYAAQVLDGDHALVEEIRSTLFSDARYQGKRIGTATLFRGDVRVATTVSLPDGREAVGTRASAEVAAGVLQGTRPWIGRARVLDDWYLTAYEPLLDPASRVIGMLYVGELEAPLREAKRQALLNGALVLAALLLAAFGVNQRLGGRLVARLVALQRSTRRLAEGDLTARTEESGADELTALARAFNHMAEEIGDDHRELVAQKERVEAVNRSYLETLGFVSHELRNGLGTALFNTAALQEGAFGDLDGDQPQGLKLVQDSLTYLNQLLLNYLQLSRIEKGELLVKLTSVALARDVLRPAVGGLQAAFASKGMPLTLDVPEDLDVQADVSLLRVVFENLLGNAYKYGRSGGRVEVRARVEGEQAVLSVFNEGVGIPPDRLGRLFNKFERLDAGEETGRRGTGLGLFIVRQILQRHGAEISAESVSGEWVRFTFTLKRSGPRDF